MTARPYADETNHDFIAGDGSWDARRNDYHQDMAKDPKPSPLGLMVLALLYEEPMHAYRMQKLMKERGKDKVVNVRQRNSIYQTIDRLLKLGFIEVRKTVKTESHPDRIVYSICRRGREIAKEWLKEMLAEIAADFPEFPAALSILPMLSPSEVQAQLELRLFSLSEQIRILAAGRQAAGDLPRLFLLDDDYRLLLLRSEMVFVKKLLSELRAGTLRWDEKWRRSVAARFTMPED